SPEQALGQELDGRTDIFSLGVVLYEMVTGVLPFQGHNSTSIVDAILHKDPVAPVRLNQETPPALEQTINRALEKNKRLRYQSASDLHAELSRIKRDSSLEALRSTSGTGAAAVAPTAQRDSSARDRGSRPAASKRLRGTLVAGVLAIVAIIGIFGWRFGRTEALAESDFILLTDFVNTTGDQVFDGALKQALAIALEESPFLNVVPESRVSATLRQMQRPPDERLTPALGREVCQRQQVKAMLTGEIAPVGSHFAITLNALNCGTGDSIARQQVEADSKERVLTAMGEAASAMRRRLGESLKSIEGTATPIPEATTASLEALKAFSTGDFTWMRGRPMDAIPFYKHAIELDPNFALAYARLATVYRNTSEREVSEAYTRTAFEMRDRVSERERLYITAQYYLNIEQDFAKATETYQLWSEMYPRDSAPRNNQGVLFSRTGQKENALKAFQESIRVAPDLELAYGNVMGILRQLGRYDESRKTLQDMKARFGETTTYHLGMFELAYVSGDAAGMQRHSSAIRATAARNGLALGEAQIAAMRGRLAEARKIITTSATTLQRQGFKETAGMYLGIASAWEALAGQCAEAQALSGAAVASSRGLVPMVTRAAVLAESARRGRRRRSSASSKHGGSRGRIPRRSRPVRAAR
ncbi:MAG: tetratricopeptide repeat-containing serine/threonine-protein kinase, partial [Acidobacteria bacterium]|nr:tetratricopeptide repeat-containing serine/threonine-protein kinase [Acidobacteriota bacterium]